MKRSRFTEEQIIGILKEQKAGLKVSGLCRTYGISDATFYKWKTRYGGLEISDALICGLWLHILAVIDDFSRRNLALVADTALSGGRMVRELTALVALRRQTPYDCQRQRYGVHILCHPEMDR